MAVWHRDRSGFGFADGHGELHQWKDKYIIEAANETSVSWFEYKDPPSEDLRFLISGYTAEIELDLNEKKRYSIRSLRGYSLMNALQGEIHSQA